VAALKPTVIGGKTDAAAGGATSIATPAHSGIFANPRSVARTTAEVPHSNVIGMHAPNGRALPVQGNFQATTPRDGPFAAADGVPVYQGNTQATPRGPFTGGPFAARNTATPSHFGPINTMTPSATEMGPPPARRPTAVTPATAVTKPREVTPAVINQLFTTEHRQLANNQVQEADTTLMQPDAPTGVAKGDAVDSFHDMHQQFSRSLRDFHEKESDYNESLLDATVNLDTAAAILLHCKVESLDIMDRMDDLIVSCNESIQTIASK
jgi:hypothetical protein